MIKGTRSVLRFWVILVLAFAIGRVWAQPAEERFPYELKTPSPDGIGKCYFGREIARVMGHAALQWLERDERVSEELPDLVVRNLDLKPADVVADIGAGSGYFTFRIAARVPQGKVYAVDIQEEMLAAVRSRAAKEKVDNVIPLLGKICDANLPAGEIELAFFVDAYHEFSHPREMMESVIRALRPGGRVILIEYRGEDPAVPIKPLHKMTQQQVKREMNSVGLTWVESRDFLPRQHFLVFRKGARPFP